MIYNIYIGIYIRYNSNEWTIDLHSHVDKKKKKKLKTVPKQSVSDGVCAV